MDRNCSALLVDFNEIFLKTTPGRREILTDNFVLLSICNISFNKYCQALKQYRTQYALTPRFFHIVHSSSQEEEESQTSPPSVQDLCIPLIEHRFK